MTIVTYVVDSGKENKKISKSNFWWINDTGDFGSSISSLVNNIVTNLALGKVSIGFEYPLYFDVYESNVNKARVIDGNRSWSGGPGATILPTGLSQTNSIVKKICKSYTDCRFKILSNFDDLSDDSNVYIWEAFVSSKGKPDKGLNQNQHLADANAALGKYLSCKEKDEKFHSNNSYPCVSLLSSIFIANECMIDLDLINERPIVIKL